MTDDRKRKTGGEVELLPLPIGTRASSLPGEREVFGYADMEACVRTNVDRALAESRAECERLRAEVEADARNVQGYIDTIAEADAQMDAAEKLAERWEKIAAEHSVRTFTGNGHLLFANELRAALNLEPRND